MSSIARVGLFVFVLLLGQIGLLWITTQNYIPQFDTAIIYLNLLVYVALFAFCLWYLKRAYATWTYSKLKRRLWGSLAALLICLWFLLSGALSTSLTTGFFSGFWVQSYRHPQLDLNLYVYDHSFLDPRSGIWLKHPYFPVRVSPVYLGCTPEEITITALPEGFRVVAPTRTVFIDRQRQIRDLPHNSGITNSSPKPTAPKTP